MIEKITHKKKLYALIVKKLINEFLIIILDKDATQQFGYMK